MRWFARILGIALIALAMLVTVTAPGLAHQVDYTYWKDNHGMCVNCKVNKGNVVGFWQSILAADAIDTFWYCGIDGYFGPVTRGSTRAWKTHYGLNRDGVAGHGAWATADNFVVHVADGRNYYYLGYYEEAYFQILRNDGGRLIWQPTDFGWDYPYYGSGHPAITFPRGPYCG